VAVASEPLQKIPAKDVIFRNLAPEDRAWVSVVAAAWKPNAVSAPVVSQFVYVLAQACAGGIRGGSHLSQQSFKLMILGLAISLNSQRGIVSRPSSGAVDMLFIQGVLWGKLEPVRCTASRALIASPPAEQCHWPHEGSGRQQQHFQRFSGRYPASLWHLA
jgi:hypothetical protein